jgi:hypothetical protein
LNRVSSRLKPTEYSVISDEIDYKKNNHQLAFAATIVFAVYATRYGLGARDPDLSSPNYRIRAAEYVMYWEVLYLVSTGLTKCAIGFTCMRMDGRRRFVIPMSINMSIIAVVSILALIYIFATCRPLAATWNPLL